MGSDRPRSSPAAGTEVGFQVARSGYKAAASGHLIWIWLPLAQHLSHAHLRNPGVWDQCTANDDTQATGEAGTAGRSGLVAPARTTNSFPTADALEELVPHIRTMYRVAAPATNTRS